MIKSILLAVAVVVPTPDLPQGIFDPVVHDGDTLKYGTLRIRLHGIDAPELSQTCKGPSASDLCGKRARDYLKRLVAGGVKCEVTDYDSRWKRPVAKCHNRRGEDVGQKMVSNGWALAYRRYSHDYVKDEFTADVLNKGMWAGDFIEPWAWRKGERW